MAAEEAYARLRGQAEGDPNVLGLVLGGSRGKGCATDRSDYDVYLVVDDDAPARARYGTRRGEPLDVAVFSLEAFAAHAALGSETEWNRYTFAHVTAGLDKLDGRIQQLVDEKGALPAPAAPQFAAEALDGYVNAYYRSAKNLRDGLALEAHLDAAESLPWLLTTLFALHGRVRPYNKYLRWELERHPLGHEWSAESLLPALERIVATGALDEQRALFRRIERLARERGHGAVIDSWEPDVALLRGR